ncbi:sphingomyelin phosphodiesterase [Cytobacillus sp. IB215316]|uniref:sphingomyelin phosphodiesterase n=1 Tax=Cytobacillus sp. IB215316 TaxID=3097354 RepID=UPI002A16942C|nr:sphingomyelin phosphodiesterase [Cytobacillus sp. IB215316]MDX8361308.1 sphingomyelin phosphodiesterase [Cytobacillus sp. IB215316]
MKKYITLLFCAFLVGITINFHQSFASSHYPNDFKLLQHNVFLMPTYASSWGQKDRATFISEADYIKGQDAIIFNELYDNNSSKILLNNIAEEYPFQTPVLGRSKDGWDETLGHYSNIVPEDGGVAIISKWPILEQIQYVFEEGCGVDYFANKGFVYVKVEKEDDYYHIIGTHAQADDTGCGTDEANRIRKTQFQEIAEFITDKDVPLDEVLFIGGDFNVNRYNVDEYQSLIDTLNVNEPTQFTGHSSTFDPETNEIVAYKFPDGYPRYLDYIFLEKNHKQPDFWTNEVLNVKSPTWTAIINKYNEFSDHYPVYGYSNIEDNSQQ